MKKLLPILSLAFIFLVACQSVSAPQISEPAPLFTDADIDNAIQLERPETNLLEPVDRGEIANGVELAELADVESDSELSSQAVLPGAEGHVYYIRHNPDLALPYQVYKHNQSTNVKTLVYKGRREIQSVSGNVVSIRTSANTIQHPSVAGDYYLNGYQAANKVMWLEDYETRQRVRVKGIQSGNFQTVVSSPRTLDHPFMERWGSL